MFEKLYGLSSTGKIKEWLIEVIDKDDHSVIRVTHGYTDGKKQVSEKKITEGKNIGKANETTHFEQANSEAQSDWNKKKDKGYLERIPREAVKKHPMLAHEYSKRKHKINWPAFAQPKLNGVRCLATRTEQGVEFKSRNGKIYYNLDHLAEILCTIMEVGQEVDGELYSHTMTFQEIVSLVRKQKEKPKGIKGIQFWLYDMPDEELPFKDRLDNLNQLLIGIREHLVPVSTTEVEKEEALFELHREFMELGYEGTMIRNKDGLYKYNHRSVDLLKYKDFTDEEFEIIGGKEGTGKAEGQCIFRCKVSEGKEFDVRCVGSNEDREEQFRNLDSYVGKMLTVRFQNFSDEGIPIFPVGLTVRDYE